MRWSETPDPWMTQGHDRPEPWQDPDQEERRACREAQQSESRRSSCRGGLLGELLEIGLEVLFELLD